MTQRNTPMTYEQLKQSHDEWRMLAMHNYGVAKAAEGREQRIKETIEMAMNEYHLWQSGDTAAPMMYGILQEAMSTLYPDTPAPTSEITARPIDEWNEDLGDVLWWTFPVNEPPYCGSPLDMDWPDYHTHWTPIVIPAAPAPKEGE